jgi:hypothetical protein
MSAAPALCLCGEGRSRYHPSALSPPHDVACVPASRRRVRGSFARRARPLPQGEQGRIVEYSNRRIYQIKTPALLDGYMGSY